MINTLNNKNILLGITGGIAAYKAPQICRSLIKSGANVQVIMSEAASHFVTPLTMETLSGRKVPVKMFERTQGPLEHIDLASWADLFLIAPATADFLARCANGRASDLISSVTLAFIGPVIIAPAMNTNMWKNPATKRNLKTLINEHEFKIINPSSGDLACGTSGEGRMEDPDTIVAQVKKLFVKDLTGKKIVISAGPTIEDIDPVRYLSNRSSGKTGYNIANSAASRGADVTLISGPVSISTPQNVKIINVRSADSMKKALEEHSDDADCIIMSAAVADFKPAIYTDKKIKKNNNNDDLTIKLKKNPDILKSLGKKYKDSNTKVVGFALETDNLLENAQKKLSEKNVQMIVANLASDSLEGESTNVTILQTNKEPIISGTISKQQLSDILLDSIFLTDD